MHDRKGFYSMKEGFLMLGRGSFESEKGFLNSDGVFLCLKKGFMHRKMVLCLGKGIIEEKRGFLYIGGGILYIGKSPNALNEG